MKKSLFCLLLVLNVSSLSAYAQEVRVTTKPAKCTSTSCGNTATGEDPQEQRIRESAAHSEKIREGNDDLRRWESIRIYSESINPEQLKMLVVKAVGLEMRLNPKLGHLSFSKQGRQQVFSIASRVDDQSSICPRYVINVMDASAGHALQQTRFDNRGDLETTLLNYLKLYNHHIAQRAIGAKTPVQA